MIIFSLHLTYFFLIGRNPNLSWCKYYKENAESNFEIKGKFIKQAHW